MEAGELTVVQVPGVPGGCRVFGEAVAGLLVTQRFPWNRLRRLEGATVSWIVFSSLSRCWGKVLSLLLIFCLSLEISVAHESLFVLFVLFWFVCVVGACFKAWAALRVTLAWWLELEGALTSGSSSSEAGAIICTALVGLCFLSKWEADLLVSMKATTTSTASSIVFGSLTHSTWTLVLTPSSPSKKCCCRSSWRVKESQRGWALLYSFFNSAANSSTDSPGFWLQLLNAAAKVLSVSTFLNRLSSCWTRAP